MDVSFTMQDISGGTDCGKNEINQFLIHSNIDKRGGTRETRNVHFR